MNANFLSVHHSRIFKGNTKRKLIFNKIFKNIYFCFTQKSIYFSDPLDRYFKSDLSIAHGNNYDILKYRTLGDELENAAKQFSNNLALFSVHQNIKMTYQELNHQVDLVARCFIGLGIKMNEKVGVYAPNCSEWLCSQFGAAKIGAVFININPAYQVKELEFTLNKCQISTLIMPRKLKKSNYVEILNLIDPGFKDKTQDKRNLKLKFLPYLKRVILLNDTTVDEIEQQTHHSSHHHHHNQSNLNDKLNKDYELLGK